MTRGSPQVGNRWFLVLDSDEIVDPWSIGRLVTSMDRNGERGASLRARTFEQSNMGQNRTDSAKLAASLHDLGCSVEAACPASLLNGLEWPQRGIVRVPME